MKVTNELKELLIEMLIVETDSVRYNGEIIKTEEYFTPKELKNLQQKKEENLLDDDYGDEKHFLLIERFVTSTLGDWNE